MAPSKRVGTVTIEGARLVFRNFKGREGKYNREGDRNFSVLLDPDLAAQMSEDGWNIKWLEPREEGDVATPYIQVSVSFKGRPPHIVMITGRNRTQIDEDLVEMLDNADMENVDVILNPYSWDVNGNTGIKAYLQTMFVTVRWDELQRKYADIEDELPSRSGRVND